MGGWIQINIDTVCFILNQKKNIVRKWSYNDFALVSFLPYKQITEALVFTVKIIFWCEKTYIL